jgi:hypothetical protein
MEVKATTLCTLFPSSKGLDIIPKTDPLDESEILSGPNQPLETIDAAPEGPRLFENTSRIARLLPVGAAAGAAALLACGVIAGAQPEKSAGAQIVVPAQESPYIQQPKGVLGFIPSGTYTKLTVRGRTAAGLDRQLFDYYDKNCRDTTSPRDFMTIFDYVAQPSTDNYGFNKLPRGKSLSELLIVNEFMKRNHYRLDLNVAKCAYSQLYQGKIMEPTIKVWIDTSKDLHNEIVEELHTAKMDGADVDWVALRMSRYPGNKKYIGVTQFAVRGITVAFNGGISVRPSVVRMQIPYGGRLLKSAIPRIQRKQDWLVMEPY